MYPPLPLPPAYPQHHQQRRYPHAIPHHMQSAMMHLPLQAWQPHDSYGNNFVVVPQRRQPPLPWKVMANPRVKGPTTTEKVKEKPKAVGKKPSPRPPVEDNQVDHRVSSNSPPVASTTVSEKPPATIVWPQDQVAAFPASSPAAVKTIWRVTPLELSSMMLVARHGKKKMYKTKVKEPKHLRSNQETHERNSSSSSDSFSDDSSSTDTDDEDVPVLKRFYGFESIDLFLCDADYDKSASPTGRGEENEKDASLLPPLSAEFAAPDYRKLFGLAPDAVPFHPANFSPTESQHEPDDEGIPPPHMMWWPGDWKCSNCGNHNFSYRETCKRCREGRFDDAGYIFAAPPY